MERETILKAAVAKCFKAREAVNVANVRKYIEPDYADFFQDFDTGKPLDDVTIFREIQAVYKVAPQPPMLIKTDPAGHALRPVESVEPFPDYLPPSDEIAAPVEPQGSVPVGTDPAPVETTAAPVANDVSAVDHAANGPGLLSPQERLDAARSIESDLIGRTASLKNAQREARGALEEAKIAYVQIDPNRQTANDVAREFRETSQRERAARAARNQPAPGQPAYVDLERRYSRGTDANSFARKMGRTLNRRGAYSQAGGTNYDKSRGPVPKPVTPPPPTIPALSK